MNLNVQDKLALMMTSAGSQRNLARFIGVSHQRIGRWLRFGHEGGSKHLPTDPGILEAINVAFDIHKQVSRAQARRDGLHFNAAAPVFIYRPLIPARERVVHANGEITYVPKRDARGNVILKQGARVVIGNTHWLSNRLRDKVIAHAHKSGKYLHASIASMVNLEIYTNRADKRMQHVRRTEIQKEYRKLLRHQIRLFKENDEPIPLDWIYTPYIPTPVNVPSDLITNRLNDYLSERHEPATGDPGTKLASQILFQVDNAKKRP